MNRVLWMVCVLWSVVVAMARSDTSKPPWQRLLSGDDAKKADGLQQRIEELENGDQYAEAIKRSAELLALRTRVQGAEHWQSVDQKWALTALQKVAALPAEKRAGWRQAVRGANEAGSLEQKAQYGKALPLKQESLKWCRRVLGEDHPDTAACYINLALNLQSQGKYAEAGPLYHKALEIRRKILDEEHPDTAKSYNNLAVNLSAQGKHTEAGPLYHKALDIRRKALGEEHPDTAASYNNVSHNLIDQGRYAEAGPLFQKALDIQRKILGEDHPNTAHGYDGVAANLSAQGKYAEAAPLFQRALDIRRKALGEEHPLTARSYNNVAFNLNAQGKYAEAEPLFQKALDIRRQALGEDHPDTADSYNSVAFNLNAQGKHTEVALLYQKALDIRRKILGEQHPDTASSYNNVAANLNAQRRYAEAGTLYQRALDIRRKAQGEQHPHTAGSYNNLAFNLQSRGQYSEAGPLYQKALDIFRQALGEDHPNTAGSYHNVAFNHSARGENAAALASLEAAARSYEAARLGIAAGLQRAAFGAERSPYPFLAAARRRAGRAADAWAALEADLARGLFDEMPLIGLSLAQRRQRDEMHAKRAPLEARVLALVSQSQRTAAESGELARLLEQRQELEKSLGELAVAVSRREVATLDQLQVALPADAAFVTWVDKSDVSGWVQEHWGCVVRPKGEPHWEHLSGSGAQGKWSPEDDLLPRQFREALAKSAPAAEIDALAKKLNAQRLSPLAKHLSGVKRLFVAPVNQMAGIPIEALTDQYTISYTPSGTYLARLKDCSPPHGTRLLAVGDPLFPPTQAPTPPTALPPGALLIVQVVPGGNAAKARLQAGDVLVAYAGERLTSIEQLRKLLDAKAKEKSVLVKVWREGQEKLTERELAAGLLGVVLANEL
jgi:tetratricopeptide (TPR) repeat protein